jgi:hypothetical protein
LGAKDRGPRIRDKLTERQYRKRMRMADDNSLRSYRSNDPLRRSAAPAGPGEQGGSDPLAELARLIGQNDPFAEFGRNSARGAEPRPPQHAAPQATPDWRQSPSGHDTRRAQQPAAEPDPHYASGHARSQGQEQETYDRYEDDRRYAPADRFQAHHDEPTREDHAHDERDRYYQDDAHVAPKDDEIYDDPPRLRRHGGLLTAVVLIVCAMLGTAGAYGYRTYYTGSGSTQTPPVIVADKTPSKVVPAATDTQSGKAIQERLGDQSSGERVVSRQEEPVQLRDPNNLSTPRVVLPAPVAPSPSGAAAAGAGSNEPKKVRTVTIRPDGADLSGKPVGGIGPAGGSQSSAASASARPAPGAKPATRGSPLSLEPQNAPASDPDPFPAAPAPRARATAPVPPPAPAAAPAPAPTRLASVPATGGSGGYMVQLSSQRSETEAQASFRSLQAKFPDELGSRQAVVRRADLGAKGIYYRAMVGPFGSSGEADQFCSGLKAAGGQCLIQKN